MGRKRISLNDVPAEAEESVGNLEAGSCELLAVGTGN